jgi:glycosyltransferase involved in cell wall biosynthesis
MIVITIYLNNNAEAGGSYRYNINLLRILKFFDSNYFHFNLVLCNKFYLPQYIDFESYSNVTIFRFNESKLQFYFQWLFKKTGINPVLFRKYFKYVMNDFWILKRTKADIYIFPSQDDKSYLYGLNAIVITMVHDLMHKFYPFFPEVSGAIRDYHYSNIVRYSDHLVVDSKIGKSHVESFYPKIGSKISILPFTFIKDEPLEFSEIIELKGVRFIFYPAQFWMHKNHLNLLKAIRMVKDEIPDILLVLTGASKNSKNLCLEYINESEIDNNVKILGFVSESEISFLYKNAVSLIFPSFFGPTNIPPLEAISFGCPIVISDVFGNKEQCGDSAIYFNPDSVESLVLAIKKIWNISELRNSLIDNARLKRMSMSEKEHFSNFYNIVSVIQKRL